MLTEDVQCWRAWQSLTSRPFDSRGRPATACLRGACKWPADCTITRRDGSHVILVLERCNNSIEERVWDRMCVAGGIRAAAVSCAVMMALVRDDELDAAHNEREPDHRDRRQQPTSATVSTAHEHIYFSPVPHTPISRVCGHLLHSPRLTEQPAPTSPFQTS